MRDYLQINLVVLAWGFTAVLGRLIAMPAVEVVGWRTALAAAGFGLLAVLLGKSLNVSRGHAVRMLVAGAVLGAHWVLFFGAARLSTAAVSLAAMPTIMIWCSLIEPWVDGTPKWRPVELALGLVISAAVGLIYQVEARYWLGFSIGLLSALLAAVFAVVNKQIVTRQHFAVIGFYQMLGACVVSCLGWLVLGVKGGAPLPPSAQDWAWLLALSLGCTIVAYIGYMDVLRRMSVFTVNVVYNMEPVYGILLAAWLLGPQEHMTPGFYVGAAIITGSVLSLPWLRRWEGNSSV